MIKITHHLSETTLGEYANGLLNEALEVVVASHLTLCPACRARSELADRMGGYFIETSENAKPALTAQQLLTRAKASDSVFQHSPDNTNSNSPATVAMEGVPQPLAQRLPANLDQIAWKRMAKGIQQVDLSNTVNGEGAFKLLKLEPGTEVWEHSHGDHELTLILRGSYTDEIGRFGVGDVADLGPKDSHEPVVDGGDPCITLIATNSPIRYKNFVGKLVQPFIGI